MSLFKCKMCGGDLEIAEGITIAECEYCGTKQTVPKAMGENLQNLFNRANTLRIKSEFDKAEKLYEKIIQSDSTQSDAYWGLILCKYGIEYVDDPETFKKIPTCHRASYDSIIADDDYKSAIDNADMGQRAIYEEQAKEIDRIQKEILALAQKEETYDVFICYKETDADGKRTQDSVIANDIYYQLTNEGFKVFYAAITLEGKLGSAYEPIIFAALNSAKVMLVIGTRPEYFNSVWVKNEWSRFLKIIKKDRSKLLIPCYRDMDAYELPEEFAHLQAQDMAKIGFINDLVRGIKKVGKKDEPKPTTVIKETAPMQTPMPVNANIVPLLKRAFLFLEDGDWDRADDFCEQILNQDPENAQAYLCKLMSELRVRKQENLKDCADTFDDNNNYQKIIRFGDDDLKNALNGYIDHIKTRNEKERLEGIYVKATNLMSQSYDAKMCQDAATLFESIKEYKDSAELAEKCLEQKKSLINDSILLKAQLNLNVNNIDYCEAIIRELESIRGWKDADELMMQLQKKVEMLKEKAEADRIERERRAIEEERRKKRNEKISIIFLSTLAAIIIFLIVLGEVIIPQNKYNKAIDMLNAGKYVEATELFSEIVDHKESRGLLTYCVCECYKQGKLLEVREFINYVDDSQLKQAFESFLDGDYRAAADNGLTDIIIPEGVTQIDDRPFYNCTSLTSLTIPNSVKRMSSSLCSGCTNLVSVTIGNGFVRISDYAFFNCSNLNSITIPDSVTMIDNYAFAFCSNLTNIEIPNSVTIIYNEVFANCTSLTSITIPSSVTSIGSFALHRCSNLTRINYKGTKAQWNAISKGYGFDKNTGNYTVYCSDGNITK